MRILFINAYYPPDAANSAYILGELTEDLAKTHDVEVVAGRPSYSPGIVTYRPEGVRVIRVPSTAFSRSRLVGRALNYATFTLFAAARACATRRPDVAVTMTDPPIIGIVGVLTAARFRRPFVQLCHDIFPDVAIAVGRLRNPFLIRVWRALNRMVRTRAAKLVVVGRDMREKLIKEGVDPEKLVFIPTWAGHQEVAPAAIKHTRRSLGWNDRFVVMHAGNMGAPQNLLTLVDAADRLRSHHSVCVVFLGDGAAKPDLVREVRERGLTNVIFMPYRPKEEAQLLMAAAHIHVVSLVTGLWGCATPSKTYGIMAAARPFIAAVDEGSEPAQIVDEFHCGVRIPPGDAAALADSILKLEHADLEAMGRRAQIAFTQRYERETATTATCQLLEEVVASS